MDKVVLMKTRGEEYQKLLDEQEEKIHDYEEKYLSINMEIARISADISEQYEMLLSAIRELHTNNITATIGEERGNKDELWHAISECLGEYKIELVNKYRKIGTSRPRKRDELIPIVKSYYETQQKIDQLTREKISVQRAASHSAEYEELIHSLKERQYVTPEEFKKVWSILIQQFPALDEECEGVLSASYAEIKGLIDEKKSLPDIEKLKQEYTVERETFLKKVEAEFQSIKPTTVSEDYSIGIRDNFDDVTEPPEQLCIGKYTSKIADCELASILASEYQIGDNNPLILDLKNKGNILINASQDDANNENLYHIVCGLIMRYLEAFPLGSLNVHIYDPMESFLFRSFVNGFVKGESQRSKNIVTKRNWDPKLFYKDIASIATSHCDSVESRLSVRDGIYNLYDLYKIDDTHNFHLFVIRSSFLNLINAGSTTEFGTLRTLIGKRGMTCGIKFIIVNDCGENTLSDTNKKNTFNEILNSVTILEFVNNQLLSQGESIDVTKVPEYEDTAFIERQCQIMAEIVAKRTKKAIPYEEIGFGGDNYSDVDKYSSALSIPIGKVGNNIFELPFHCGKSDYPNVGCMAIGQTGMGKSSLFHSIVINGCWKYSPDDLEFWLLDFKSDKEKSSTAGTYNDANIPHIGLISSQNNTDDACCLFDLLENEMQNRIRELARLGNEVLGGTSFANIAAYNKYVDAHPELGKEHLSRILVVIDEAQDMIINCTPDEKETLLASIENIATKGRSSGIHLIMIAQKLPGDLEKNFVRNIKCKCSFNVEENVLIDSGFNRDFSKENVSKLEQGECCITPDGKNKTIAKIAFVDSEDLQIYLSKIREKYHEFTVTTRVIGNKTALSPHSKPNWCDKTYDELVRTPTYFSKKRVYSFVFGEDAYLLNPAKFNFTPNPSSVYACGGDERMRSAICGSILLSAANLMDKELYICGDIDRGFKKIIQKCQSNTVDMKIYASDNIDNLVKEVYLKLIERRNIKAKTIGDNIYFTPIFVIVNNFTGIPKIIDNIIISSDKKINPGESTLHNSQNEPRTSRLEARLKNMRQNGSHNGCGMGDNRDESVIFDKEILKVVSEILEYGSSLGIYFNITATKVEAKLIDRFAETGNKVVFNSVFEENIPLPSISKDSKNHLSKSRIISMLHNLSSLGVQEEETLAISIIDKIISKVRPVIYDDNEY